MTLVPTPDPAAAQALFDVQRLLRHAPVTLYACAPDGDFGVRFVSHSVVELLGHAPEAFVRRPAFWIDHIHPDDREAIVQERRGIGVQETLLRKYRFRCADGDWKWIRDRARRVPACRPDGRGEIVGAWNDITELIAAEELLRHSEARHRFLAHYDPLTDLPNRTLVQQRIDQAIVQAGEQGRSMALLFLDLNDFKLVNDSLGHACGDQLLRQVGRRLEQGVRQGDTVGRLGGDEFVVLLPSDGPAGAAKVAQKIQSLLEAPFEVDGQRLFVRTSIGISVYPRDGADRSALTRHADIAMYQAKEGGGGYRLFHPAMQAGRENRHALEVELRIALEQQQFLLHYQPQVSVATGRIVGVEALVRWQHPQRGLVSPMEFIPLAERTLLIQPLGRWIIAQVCRDLLRWQAQGLPRITVALNLSLRQLQEPRFLADFLATLDAEAVPADCLEWEITESTMMQNPDVVRDFMEPCRRRGIRFSIDDFGSGYSSLGMLNRLPLDRIKIDQAFIRDMAQDASMHAIVRAILVMARSLGLGVVAEGVENAEQFACLQALHCDVVQGYHFSRPVPAQVLAALLADEAAQAAARWARPEGIWGPGGRLLFAV